jgi:hypothetical protein
LAGEEFLGEKNIVKKHDYNSNCFRELLGVNLATLEWLGTKTISVELRPQFGMQLESERLKSERQLFPKYHQKSGLFAFTVYLISSNRRFLVTINYSCLSIA